MDETLEVGAVRKRRRYTQSERRTLSERRIMDAALKLIARQGSSRTTLAEIGAVAGYTHGLVSHRFGSKGALVRVVMRHLQAHFAKRTAPDVEHLTGLEALKVLMRSYLSGPGPDSVGQRAFHVLIGEALGPVPDIRADIAEADQRFRRSLEKRLEEGIQSGELRRDIDPVAQAAILVATLRGIMLQRLINPAAFDLERVWNALETTIDRSLRP